MSFYNVESEVDKLEAVLLHRPGKELERLTPQYLEELLFDDIPWAHKMQEEHDQFAETLRANGTKVYYYRELLEDILKQESVKRGLINDITAFTGVDRLKESEIIREYLSASDHEKLAEVLISGLHKNDVEFNLLNQSLSHYITDDYPYYINPIPNLYFTRDPGAVIGNGISINSMKTNARNRETMLLDYINRHHNEINITENPSWYNYKHLDPIEGGDILILNRETIAVGCSARTSPEAIERLAENLFNSDSPVRQVLAIQIPFKRAYMHLDTVFTMLDYNKFIIFPEIKNDIKLFLLTPGEGKRSEVKVTPLKDLKRTLERLLKVDDVLIIESGGGDKITAAREQWNDSTNTLAIAPGKVITYRRNQVSNETLIKNGVDVIAIEGSELVRGRGGPRCMSMPLRRNRINI